MMVYILALIRRYIITFANLMYVEEIILEGFKTYMNRTVISGFDPQFNAITGLNGSGKSNILDAIQFLLGSTSKEMLRLKAGLTELIYKQGFAGIQKASVTIKFRCTQKQMRPTGYQNFQELIVTRQITKDKITKFFVNGVSSNLTKVKNLFRSIQLNIENPHFLVKQGQITKIINLKPLQLLGMIQQTAGTAYYNKTKMQSQKIIEKKEQKLKAINDILNQSIQPQMQKLDADRRRYIAYKDKQSLLNHLDQKLRMFQLTIKQKNFNQRQLDLENCKETIDFRRKQLRTNAERLGELQIHLKQLSSKTSNSPLNEYNKIKSIISEKDNERNHIKARIQKLNNEAITSKKELAETQTELQEKKKEKQWQEKTLLQNEKQREEIQNLMQEYGRSSNEKDAAQMIEKQIAQEQGRIKSLNTEIKIMNGKKDTLKAQTQNEKKIMAEMSQNNENLAQSLKEIESEIQQIEKLQAPPTVEDPQLSNTTLRELDNNKKKLLNQCYQLNFYYQDPQNGFDRRKVKGKVFMLFKAKEKLHEKALQIGGGGRLMNIVVENEIVSKQLIERQSFGKNVTIIPNNRIRFKSVSQQSINFAMRTAKQLGGLARPAYQLITYSKQIQNSMMFAFSNFFVCSSPEIAQKIAYNPNKFLSCRCVTFDGDIYENGSLSGGYINQSNFILPQYSQLCQIQSKIKKQRQVFQIQKQKYENYQKALNEYRNKQKQLQSKINRKQKIKTKLLNFNLNIKKRDFKKELQDIQFKLNELMVERQQHLAKIQTFKNNIKNHKVKSIKEQREQLEKELKKFVSKISDGKKKISHLEVQIEELKLTVKHIGVTANDLEKEIIDLQKKEREVSNHLRQYHRQFQRVQEQKKKFQKDMQINETKFKSVLSEQHELKARQENIESELNSLESNQDNIKKELGEIKRFIQGLLEKYAWLDQNEDYAIDAGFNYEATKAQYKTVEGQVDKLKRTAKLNIDDHSYQKLHEQYKNLLQKRQTLEKDKVTLLNNMHDLDQKRTKTLQKCFQSVKINLSKIFNDLLPGASAHLTLLDDRDVTKGAQLSVHFNSVKKQLSELSGGQRSLLALSFILALLLYKPSPFYILDEIDSALDLSHTENIGYMISQRFPQSQFLLISLKEGMFQNANVLYKVHFGEGESKVQRQVLKQIKKK